MGFLLPFSRAFMKRRILSKNSRYLYVLLLVIIWFFWIRKDGREWTRICPDFRTSLPVGLDVEDPCLINYIRKYRLDPPSRLPYQMSDSNLSQAKHILSSVWMGMDHFWTDAIFLAERLIPKERQTKRFFECGASDGEFMSQTYFAERFLGWTGLLVEADPHYYQILLGKHRKATHVGVCASTSQKSAVVNFMHTEKMFVNNTEYSVPGNGRLINSEMPTSQENGTKTIEVFCAPVYSMLLASNMLSFDIFFLDIEGPELEVLRTLPFDKIDVAIFVVEHNGVEGKLRKLEEFFEEKGYLLQESSLIDSLFIKKEYANNRNSEMTVNDFYDQIKNWYNLAPVFE